MARGNSTIKVDLNAQAREILKKATEKGVEHSFMFVTTFKRYQEHITHLAELQKAILEEGTMVTTVWAVQKGCMFVRVHNVQANVRAIKMAEALLRN